MLLVLAMLCLMAVLVAVAVRQEERLVAAVGDPRTPRPDTRRHRGATLG
ncbi:MAG: hypothetical protein ACT4QF_05285 [Sporichthyaceae bacterium]